MTQSTYQMMLYGIQKAMEQFPCLLRELNLRDLTLTYAKALSRTQKKYDEKNLDHHIKPE